MIPTLRSLRNYKLNTFEDVSKALTFLERAVQDALQDTGSTKAIRTDQSITANYGQSIFTSGTYVTLPSSLQGGNLITITNTGTNPLWVHPANTSETINGSASIALGSKCTIRLNSDGAKGWWG